MLALLAGFAFLAAAIAAAPRAEGQVFSSQPYVAAPDPAVEDLRNRLNALESDLKKATDRAERLAFDLANAKRTADEASAKSRQLEADVQLLKDKVEALEAIAGGNPEQAAAARSAQAAETTINLVPQNNSGGGLAAVDIAQLPQDEEGLLKEAKNLLLGGNYPAAQQASASFLAKYPKSKSASDAQYMLADALLYQDNYQDAANAYGKLAGAYPKSENAPSALVKFARALRLMDKKTDACKTLDLMSKQYPKAPAAAKTMATSERQKANCK